MTDQTYTQPAQVPVFQAINAIIAEMGGIGKNQRNKDQNYNFRGVDDVLKVLHPLFAKHGIIFAPNILEREYEERISKQGNTGHCAHLHVGYKVYGPMGDFLEISTWGEGLDYSDKATNKAMTAAFKYAMFELFAISDPDDDSDKTSEEGSGSHNEDGGAPRGRVPMGENADDIKVILQGADLDPSNEFLNDLATKYNKWGKLSEKQIGAGVRQALPLVNGAGRSSSAPISSSDTERQSQVIRSIQGLTDDQKADLSSMWDEKALPSIKTGMNADQLEQAEKLVGFISNPGGTE